MDRGNSFNAELLKRRSLDARPTPPRCADYDSDCDEVENKLHCWLYDPAKGYCPYLRKL